MAETADGINKPVVIVEKVGIGSQRSAIDQFGLGEKVLILRRNLTLEEIADRINRLTPEGAPNISISQISKYCEKHGVSADKKSLTRTLKPLNINSVEEAVSVKARVQRHVRKLEDIVDQVKDDQERLSEIAAISNAYLAACKTLLEVNKTISKIEKEHYGHDKVRKVLKTLLQTLDEFPEVKVRFMERMRESSVYETIKYV